MYATCLFCNRALGHNQVLETFPVGRRLAFDAEKGRLWVVCRHCERWNLSPLEERWEAIEAAERFFRDTRVRVSTEHIGLARHREGLELVRIGRPLRPEFAAWRYGDQFGRRRRTSLMTAGAVTIGIGSALTLGWVTGLITFPLLLNTGTFYQSWQNRRTRALLRLPTGEVMKLKRMDLWNVELIPDAASGDWSIAVPRQDQERAVFTGAEARRIAAHLMPAINATGGKPAVVQQAVHELDESGGPDRFLTNVERFKPSKRRYIADRYVLPGNMPAPTRLALEMALHEEQERRALEGELKELELAWRAAEEIAAISDDLLLAPAVRAKLTEQ